MLFLFLLSRMAAPLLMSVDLRTIRPEFKAILKNRKIIAVDQDPLGRNLQRNIFDNICTSA